MANLQANLRSQYVAAQDDVASLLASVNRLFYDNTPEASYATLFFGTYDDATRQLRYVNCGHFAPLLLSNDGTLIRLDSTCSVLGIFDNLRCQAAEIQLFPGDSLILYTDGVTESIDAADTEFGEQRLADAVRANAHLPLRSY